MKSLVKHLLRPFGNRISFGRGTFLGEMRFLKPRMQLIKKAYEELNYFLEKNRDIYNDNFPFYNSLHTNALVAEKKGLTEQMNIAQSTINYREAEYTCLTQVREAYEKNDQEAIYAALKEFIEKYKLSNYEVIGTKSGLRVYAGVSQTYKKNRTWKFASSASISPKDYAGRLKKILLEGYESSFMGLNGDILGRAYERNLRALARR